MALSVVRRKGRKNRKYGRNKVKCVAYRSGRSVRNKLRKLNRHLAAHPNDGLAIVALKKANSL